MPDERKPKLVWIFFLYWLLFFSKRIILKIYLFNFLDDFVDDVQKEKAKEKSEESQKKEQKTDKRQEEIVTECNYNILYIYNL